MTRDAEAASGQPLPPEAYAYYADGHEAARLAKGHGPIEWVCTQELLERHLPPPPARVLDVGCPTGGRDRRVH